jgi:hypothetical protein
MTVVDSGFCFEMHTTPALSYTCFGTALNVVEAIICLLMFGYSMVKMQKNHRRALAGYTKNTVVQSLVLLHPFIFYIQINIDVHMNMMVALAMWCLTWGVYNLFDFSDDASLNEEDKLKHRRLFGWSIGLIYGFTSSLEAAVLFLLCSPSIGKNAFRNSSIGAL